jgi:methylphosphotriester-DNA--protein-cysteine methyltransferase
MLKTIILGLMVTLMAMGEVVHFGASSKVYHATVTCSAKGGKHKLSSEKAVAEAHGLRACKRCAAVAAAKAAGCTTDTDCEQKAAAGKKKAAGNAAWAVAK